MENAPRLTRRGLSPCPHGVRTSLAHHGARGQEKPRGRGDPPRGHPHLYARSLKRDPNLPHGSRRVRIRRSVHWRLGQPISLPFVACIGDVHPELIDGAPPPPKPLKPKRRECGPRLTAEKHPPRVGQARTATPGRSAIRSGHAPDRAGRRVNIDGPRRERAVAVR